MIDAEKSDIAMLGMTVNMNVIAQCISHRRKILVVHQFTSKQTIGALSFG